MLQTKMWKEGLDFREESVEVVQASGPDTFQGEVLQVCLNKWKLQEIGHIGATFLDSLLTCLWNSLPEDLKAA